MFSQSIPFPYDWTSLRSNYSIYRWGVHRVHSRVHAEQETIKARLYSENHETRSDALNELELARVESVILGNCYLESSTNFLGAKILGEHFFQKTIEMNKLWEKIRLLHLLYKREIPQNEDHVYQKVNKLCKLRSDYVHPKTTEKNGFMTAIHEEIGNTIATLDTAKEAVDEFTLYARTLWPDFV